MGQSLTRRAELADEAATAELAAALVAALPDDKTGWLLLLKGELGAGKTTLARAFLRALGHRGTVPSPTYTLVEPYELAAGTVYHVDLYRIADTEELEFLGWADLRDGLLLVEWPERAPGIEADADLEIRLDYADSGRSARIVAHSERGAAALSAVSLTAETP